MQNIIRVFTTREIASGIWIFIFFVYIFSHRKVRESFIKVVKVAFGKKLLFFWFVIILYISIVTFLFTQLPFWDNLFLKDIIFWFIFTGLSLCINSVSNKTDENYIKMVLKENIKLVIIFEFIYSTFTFALWQELILIPLATILVVLDTFTKNDKQNVDVNKFIHYLYIIFGTLVIFGTINVIIDAYEEINILNTVISFFIPIVYLILIIPLEYFLTLYSKYETLFMRMSIKGDGQVNNRRVVLKKCGISLKKVIKLEKIYTRWPMIKINQKEFDKIIEKLEKSN